MSVHSPYICLALKLTDHPDEQDKSKFNNLHDSIRACDEILGSVELSLTQFQNDLGAVSAEIETLQARSTALGLRLENRRAVEAALGPIVEEITISPYVVKKISEGAIDEQWIVALNEVEKRSKTIEGKSKELGDVKGLVDLKPLLEQLIAMVGSGLVFNGLSILTRTAGY